MHVNRRLILKTLGIGSGAFMLAPWQAPKLVAAPKQAFRNFVFCYFQGGWDTLLSLDPRDPNVYKGAVANERKTELEWERLNDRFRDGTPIQSGSLIQPSGSKIEFGPAAVAFAKHFDKSCVVRGINMDTVTHAVGRRFFITGKPPQGLNANGSSVPTQIVAQQGDLSTIPNLAVRVESYNQGLAAFASGLRVSNIYDLLSTLKDGPQAPRDTMRTLLEAYRRDAQDCDPVSLNSDGLLTLLRNAQVKSRTLVDGGLGSMFNFLDSKDPEMVKIKQRYSITSLSSAEAQAAMAYTAIKNNIAQCISIELASGLDTHGEEWAADHPEKQYTGFKALATLVDDLSKEPHKLDSSKTLLDYTTIVVFSEFGRTARINTRDGRDHSLTNSALLIGAGVPHNKVVGASSIIGMNPEAIDPQTGEIASSGGAVIKPTDVIASVMESAGFDTSHLRAKGWPCMMNKTR